MCVCVISHLSPEPRKVPFQEAGRQWHERKLRHSGRAAAAPENNFKTKGAAKGAKDRRDRSRYKKKKPWQHQRK